MYDFIQWVKLDHVLWRKCFLHCYTHDMPPLHNHLPKAPCQFGVLFKLPKSSNSPTARQCHHCPASASQHVLSVFTISDSEIDSHSSREEVGFIPKTQTQSTKVHSENWMRLARAGDPASNTNNIQEELYICNITVPSCPWSTLQILPEPGKLYRCPREEGWYFKQLLWESNSFTFRNPCVD